VKRIYPSKSLIKEIRYRREGLSNLIRIVKIHDKAGQNKKHINRKIAIPEKSHYGF
tara:strand:+ start:53235 stop:53402 length:168 start_codon:yes stop_codon:yes gene_type:complete